MSTVENHVYAKIYRKRFESLASDLHVIASDLGKDGFEDSLTFATKRFGVVENLGHVILEAFNDHQLDAAPALSDLMQWYRGESKNPAAELPNLRYYLRIYVDPNWQWNPSQIRATKQNLAPMYLCLFHKHHPAMAPANPLDNLAWIEAHMHLSHSRIFQRQWLIEHFNQLGDMDTLPELQCRACYR